MTTITEPNAKTAEIKARLDHPIVDADAHQLEVIPVLLEFLRDAGGPGMPDRFLEYFVWVRRTFRLTPEERLDQRSAVPVWWPMPTENTIDRATTVLPGLLYERMDEIGLDFSIVYPGTGLLVVTLPGMADDELRRAAARAYNLYNAEMFRGLEDRLTPAAVIPMHTPDEAIEELDYAIGTWASRRRSSRATSCARCRRPRVSTPTPRARSCTRTASASTAHTTTTPCGRSASTSGSRRRSTRVRSAAGRAQSVSRHQYNQLGGFAEGGEAIAKSLFFGGVPNRFPTLKLGFLEGGVAWGQALYCRMLEHWKKRNAEAILGLDPALLDKQYFKKLIDEHGNDRVKAHRDRLVDDLSWADHPEELDDWRACGLETEEDVYRQFVPNFFYGCEGDDRLNACAFDTKVNPMGARLNAMFGSDIGHFDVEDMAEIIEEVYELVEDDLVTETDFRDFTFENAVRLHGGMNPKFFEGTSVHDEAAEVLAKANAQ